MEYKFGGEWCLGKKIASGSFGEIFKGTHIYTHEEVAIKLEPIASNTNQLLQEAKTLKRLEGALGFPKVRWYGHKIGFNVLVLDLLGPNLQELFNSVKKKLSLKTVLLIADQLISRIQALHSYHYLHRDIKPENILIGRGKFADLLYLIDFGLSKKFKKASKEHIRYREGKGFTGNQRFSSNNALVGIEQGRRDDLESICYVLIYFFKGCLPWEGIRQATPSLKKEALIQSKVLLSAEALCEGCPAVFYNFLTYTKSLPFSSKPDNSYLRKIFRDAFVQNEFVYDNWFEWKAQNVYLTNTATNPLVKAQEYVGKDYSNENNADNQEDKETKDSSCLIS